MIRNLLIRHIGANPSFLSLEIETLSPEKTISWKEDLQLGKRGTHDPSGGAAAPPAPPARESFFPIFDLRHFGVWAQFWLKKLNAWFRFGGFLSERRPVTKG